MLQSNILERVNQQASNVLNNSPFTDLEKNLKAVVLAILNKLDLVTREEFDIQQKILLDTRKKLEKLEQRLNNLK